VKTNEFVVTFVPTLEVVGEVPQGKAITSQDVAELFSVHANETVFVVTFDIINDVGFKQVAAGPQVTLAIQPGLLIALSLLNLKVNEPSGLVEVIDPGLIVPQKAPGKPPGIFPAGLVLDICGALIEFPL
jgi:hypothetical protein